jgi:hypothetical protein
MAFVEAPQGRDEIALIPQRVKGPCVLNLGDKTSGLGLDWEKGLFPVQTIPSRYWAHEKLLLR